MNEVCEQLARTGLSLYGSTAIAISFIAIGYLGVYKRSAVQKTFLSIFILLLSATLSPLILISSASAQSNNTCPPEPSVNNSHVPEDNTNAVHAHNDGPFTIGASESNIIDINVVDNDIPGAGTFNLATLDLDPSTPEIDNYFDYDDSAITGTFTHFSNNGVVRFQPATTLSPGDIISSPYTIRTVLGELAGPANIIIEVADNIAQGDRVIFCGTDRYGYELPTNNDYHPSGLDISTIDLNPSVTGIQTTFSTSDGILFEVDTLGEVTITLPTSGLGSGSTVDPRTVIYYTVRTNNGITSNAAPIWLQWTGDCPAG